MKNKILLVEDEELIITLLENKLTEKGYLLSIARDGEEGLKKMKESKPDIILLDIIMPKKGGFEVMKIMKKDKELKDVPIIVLSNSGQPVEIEKIKKLGAKDWLIKAEFDPEEIVEKIKKQLIE